ncbi:hypothetical protein BSKO_01163 [Bryopsis sp. KO-2023]|nr:hypothetical protein BSKO_01163 [Bryopsis sp. KO-2023]
MAPKQMEFLASLRRQNPQIGEALEQLSAQYDAKLWHQVTQKLEEVFDLAESQPPLGSMLISLYDNFIADFAGKLNLLKLAHLAVRVSKHYSEIDQRLAFLEGVVESLKQLRHVKVEEPSLYLRMHIGENKLLKGDVVACKALMEEGKEKLESATDFDPSVSATVHYVCSQFHKAQKDFGEFYKSALMYLAYTSSDSLPKDFKLALGVDISLSALLADNVFNFGELLLHPILEILDASSFKWLHELLEVFNTGDIGRYDEMCQQYDKDLRAQPALVECQRQLREKITIMCLLELIFRLPAEERQISLQVIADRTKLSLDGVEFLLMKALSLHLIEGSIDQVDGFVQVSWVQPRVLTFPEMQGLCERLDGWASKVKSVNLALEQETVGVVEV